MKMKYNIFKILALVVCISPFTVFAQEEAVKEPEKTTDKPVKQTFQSGTLINNQTVVGLKKKSLEFMIQHRFGLIKDESNMYGMFDPANIRFGLGYGLTERFTVGLGVTKNKHVYDINGKYVILRQTKSGKMPVTVTAYGEMCRSGLSDENFFNQTQKYNANDRYSYFSELMVGRKFNDHFSFQAAFTYSYLNIVPVGMLNANMGASIGARYKFSNQSSVILDFDYPITSQTDATLQPKPNIGLGLEVSTSGHQFQIFITTADGILNNVSRTYNQNDFLNRQLMIGFNINRLWSF